MEAQVLAAEAPTGVLDQVRDLRELIEASALAHEHASQLGDDVRAAIEGSDILRMVAPRAVGGLEADPLSLIEVLRQLAYYDASTA